MLMIFGIVVENRAFVHTGAVVVVLANYGRFWADLLAFFVRPYKDGPLQGVAFLFPPYTVYYLTAHWDRMKPIVRRIATSCIPIVLVVLAYAFLPSVNPAVKDVQGVAAKIEAGKQELDKEIDSDLKKVERRGPDAIRARGRRKPAPKSEHELTHGRRRMAAANRLLSTDPAPAVTIELTERIASRPPCGSRMPSARLPAAMQPVDDQAEP